MVPWPPQPQLLSCLTLLQVPQTDHLQMPLPLMPPLFPFKNYSMSPYFLIWYSGLSTFWPHKTLPASLLLLSRDILPWPLCVPYCPRPCSVFPSCRPVLALPHRLLLHDVTSTNSVYFSKSSPSSCSYTKSPGTPLQSLVLLRLTSTRAPFVILGIVFVLVFSSSLFRKHLGIYIIPP